MLKREPEREAKNKEEGETGWFRDGIKQRLVCLGVLVVAQFDCDCSRCSSCLRCRGLVKRRSGEVARVSSELHHQ